jgi:8-hydroxy-5-deazaflavin:NADPH oxidoreductase
MKSIGSFTKTIAILGGTGKEGKGLSYRLAQAGYKIYIGSRSLEKAQNTANELLTNFSGQFRIHGSTYTEAVRRSDIIILSVPYIAHREVLVSIKDYMMGKLLIDVTVPIFGKEIDRANIPPSESAAQEARMILGENAEVCAAFQNISYKNLLDFSGCECDVLVTGTSEAARQETINIVANVGYRGWDAGPIENSIVVEGLTRLLIYINRQYKSSHAGIKITGV